MLIKVFKAYKASFSGLSKEVWWLALVTFINRAGTMVFPFLSLYLTDSKGFTLNTVGWIMTSFGLGSILGSYLGGKLTDKIGYYKVIHLSLIMAGIIFFNIQFIDDFWSFCIGMFLVTLFADMFRPAMYVALNTYSQPKNKTRSVTLIRLAINLGFSFGPAAGGLIIATVSYAALFWIDGLTCLLASVILFFVLNEKPVTKTLNNSDQLKQLIKSPYKDQPYMLFLLIVFLSAFMFVQLFSTLPLYFKNVHALSESEIGWLLSVNGIIIFLLEMPLISYLENKSWSKIQILTFGNFLIALSFLVLNFSPWVGLILLSTLFITFGEMLAFPFANSFTMDRANGGKQGAYIALFPISFGIAHLIAPNVGMQMINRYGYNSTWYFITFIGIISVLLGYWLIIKLKKESLKTT
jgi:predicted MFS family arabinose efflux permease